MESETTIEFDADGNAVTVLPTVFGGALTPGNTWRTVPAQSGFYTSRDLLDATYGFFEPRPNVQQLTCECGAMTLYVDARVEGIECSKCYGSLVRNEGMFVLDHYDVLRRQQHHSTLEHGGKKYQWWSNHWWTVDKRGNRITNVRDRALIAALTRRMFPPKPERVVPKLQEYGWTDEERAKYRTPPPSLLKVPCSCISQEAHDLIGGDSHDRLIATCARHQDECGTCGVDHRAASA